MKYKIGIIEGNRMNYLLNQILHLLRIEQIENDFIVERCCLSDIVKDALNEQKNFFLQNEVYPKRIFDFCYTGNNGRKKQGESSGRP